MQANQLYYIKLLCFKHISYNTYKEESFFFINAWTQLKCFAHLSIVWFFIFCIRFYF